MKKMYIILISVFLLCSCGSNSIKEEVDVINIDSIKAQEIINDNNYVIVDVREIHEYEEEHIKNSINIPLGEIVNIENRVAKTVEVIVYCRSGNRSKEAAKELVKLGYEKVYNLGGIDTITLEKETGKEDEEIS